MKKNIIIIKNTILNIIKTKTQIFVENKKLIRKAIKNIYNKKNIYTYNNKILIKENIILKDFKKAKKINIYIGIINNYNRKYIFKTLSNFIQEETLIKKISKYIILFNVKKKKYIFIEIINKILNNCLIKKIFLKNKFYKINTKTKNQFIKINKNNTKNIIKYKIKNHIINKNIIKFSKNILIISINNKTIKYKKII